MAIAQQDLNMVLTPFEHSLLAESGVSQPNSAHNLRICALISLVVGAISTIWFLTIGPNLVAGSALLISNSFYLYAMSKQREDSHSLIRKLRGDPHLGRRAIDTAIPQELSQS